MKKTIAANRVFAASFVMLCLLLSSKADAHLLDRSLSFANLVIELKTPEKIARYMWKNFVFEEDRRQFGREEYWQSPDEFMDTRRGDCEDFAIFANEALKRNGMTSFILNIYGSRYSHTICVFSENGRYGAIDGSKIIRSKSSNLKDLISRIQPFWDNAAIVTPSAVSKRGSILSQFSKRVQASRHLSASS